MNRNNNDVERKEILCNFLCLYSQMTKAMSSTIKIEDLSQDNLSNIILDFSYFSHKVSLSETNSTRRCGLWTVDCGATYPDEGSLSSVKAQLLSLKLVLYKKVIGAVVRRGKRERWCGGLVV